ncbi:epoxide hydrolase N-terminal domain-containing protein, partial [Rhizobium johnstonii]
DGPATPIEAYETIRPFQIHFPQSQLDDLRKRIAETRWPDKETLSDVSQGIQLSRVHDLVRYWCTDYDWRKAEAEL